MLFVKDPCKRNIDCTSGYCNNEICERPIASGLCRFYGADSQCPEGHYCDISSGLPVCKPKLSTSLSNDKWRKSPSYDKAEGTFKPNLDCSLPRDHVATPASSSPCRINGYCAKLPVVKKFPCLLNYLAGKHKAIDESIQLANADRVKQKVDSYATNADRVKKKVDSYATNADRVKQQVDSYATNADRLKCKPFPPSSTSSNNSHPVPTTGWKSPKGRTHQQQADYEITTLLGAVAGIVLLVAVVVMLFRVYRRRRRGRKPDSDSQLLRVPLTTAPSPNFVVGESPYPPGYTTGGPHHHQSHMASKPSRHPSYMVSEPLNPPNCVATEHSPSSAVAGYEQPGEDTMSGEKR